MRPGSSPHNAGYCGLANSELFSDTLLANSLSGIEASDTFDVPRIEVGLLDPLAPCWVLGRGAFRSSAFDVPVGGVISVSSQEQMIWANACPVVAGVADQHSVWNYSVEQFPYEAMRSEMLASDLQSSIARAPKALILPATTGLSNAGPEPFVRGSYLLDEGAFAATEPPSAAVHLTDGRMELRATYSTVSLDTGASNHVCSLPRVYHRPIVVS